MTWIKIDDAFPNHPKIAGLSNEAFRAHVEALCYCGTYLTDGFIPSVIVSKNKIELAATELVEAGLWDISDNGYTIHNYLEYQSSKDEVKSAKEANKARSERYREKRELVTAESRVSHASPTHDESRAGDALVTHPDTDTDTDTDIDTEIRTSFGTELEIPLPRVNSAKEAVTRISLKLETARANGINAWNLSRLIEDEWDQLHTANDIGGCIALTSWYVSELQSRKLSTQEIARIGQMTKRFGRIALLAIDEAASKDLTDLVSYAFRIAQNQYKVKAGK